MVCFAFKTNRSYTVYTAHLPVSDEEVFIGCHSDVSRFTESFCVFVARGWLKPLAQNQRRLDLFTRLELEYLQPRAILSTNCEGAVNDRIELEQRTVVDEFRNSKHGTGYKHCVHLEG